MNLSIRIFQCTIKSNASVIMIIVDGIGATPVTDVYDIHTPDVTRWPAVSLVIYFNLKKWRTVFEYGRPYPREDGMSFSMRKIKRWNSSNFEFVEGGETSASNWYPVSLTDTSLLTLLVHRLRAHIDNDNPAHWLFLDCIVTRDIVQEHCHMVFDALENMAGQTKQ